MWVKHKFKIKASSTGKIVKYENSQQYCCRHEFKSSTNLYHVHILGADGSIIASSDHSLKYKKVSGNDLHHIVRNLNLNLDSLWLEMNSEGEFTARTRDFVNISSVARFDVEDLAAAFRLGALLFASEDKESFIDKSLYYFLKAKT